VRPGFGRVHVEVEIANFYPAIATWVARWFYRQTQSRIHVMVTHGFLRSLARLDLEPSAVGRFDKRPRKPVEQPPWALAAVAALVAAVLFFRRR
jgi:phenylalanine-4-hydroxylase